MWWTTPVISRLGVDTGSHSEPKSCNDSVLHVKITWNIIACHTSSVYKPGPLKLHNLSLKKYALFEGIAWLILCCSLSVA